MGKPAAVVEGNEENLIALRKVESVSRSRRLDLLIREYEELCNTVRPNRSIGERTIGIVAISPLGLFDKP